MKINHPVKGMIEFQPYDYQKEVIQKLVNENKNVIVFSSRQMGTSTTIFYCMRELCLRSPGYKALLVTCNSYGYDGLNRFIDNEFIKSRSKFRIEYENGSMIDMITNTQFDDIKDGYHLFYDLYDSIEQKTLHKLWLTSKNMTPRLYSFAGNSDVVDNIHWNHFDKLKWNWDLHPDRNQIWYDDQEKIIGSEQAKKELVVK